VSGELTVFVEEFDFFTGMVATIKWHLPLRPGPQRPLVHHSSGVGIIMRPGTTAMKQGPRLRRLRTAPGPEILAVSNVDKMVAFVKNVDEGLEYYKPGRHQYHLKTAKKFAN